MSSSLPHILHVIDGLAPGGAERVLVEIANETDKNRYRVSVCVTHSDVTLASLLDRQISVFILDRHHRLELDKFKRFAEICRCEKVDIIQAHMRSSFLFVCALQAMGILQRLPIIFHEHTGVEINNHIPLEVQLGMKLLHPYFVGVNSELTQSATDCGISNERASTIPNAIKFSRYQVRPSKSLEEILGYTVDSPVGIMVANIWQMKNHLFFLDAMGKLQDEKWTVLLVGGATDSTYFANVKSRVNELGLGKRIIFLGTRIDIPQLLRLADFGIFSSKSETGPVVLLEYIAAELPFVSTSVGLVGKSLRELGIPCLVETNDLNGFVRGIQELIHIDKNERAKRTEQALRLTSPIFDIDSVMANWYMLYDKILGS
jgi:glycosyltransferase involved in cell wall biosynthesis